MDYQTYKTESEQYRRRYAAYNRIKKFLMAGQFRYYHRLEVKGLENIPKGPAVIAPNHTGGLDLDLLAMGCFAHPARSITPMITEGWHFLNSLWGKWVVGMGIPLPLRGGFRYEYLDPYLREGGEEYPGLVCLFPEGNIRPFRERNTLGVFYPGVVRLAVRYGVPVIPAGLSGFAEASPVIGVMVRDRAPDDILCLPFAFPFKLRVEFGRPIDLGEYASRDLSREEEYWIANNIIRPEVLGLLRKHLPAVAGEIKVKMKKP